MNRLATGTLVGNPPISDSESHTNAFACLVDYSERDAAHVHVSGELDIATAPQLTEALDAALTKASLVLVDLSRLTFIDCIGLGAITAGHSRARSSARKLVLSSITAQVHRLLEITGTAARFEIASIAPGAEDAADQIDAGQTFWDRNELVSDHHGAPA
jgi:anti-sigma B factor antagonist